MLKKVSKITRVGRSLRACGLGCEIRGRRSAFSRVVLVLLILSPVTAFAAADVGDYQLSLNKDPGIVMGDSSATVSMTLANVSAPGGDTIAWFRLYVDANNYYISNSNTAPAGWSITEIKNAGVGQSYATYMALAGSELALGDSVSIDLVVTGANDGPFPSASANVTDSLESAAVQVNSNPNSDFFTGAIPNWTRFGLKATLQAYPSTLAVDDLISVDMVVTNRTLASQAAVTSGTLTVSGSGSAAYVSGPVPAQATILPGAQQSFAYTYSASSPGNVIFSGAASNGTPTTVSSPQLVTNGVEIGIFTAVAGMSPSYVISGQQVTVSLSLTNNGPDVITGITPYIVPSGSATVTNVSGPTPVAIGGLPKGKSKSATVQWVYVVTGNVGDTYSFDVWGEDSTSLVSNVATTQVGRIFSYAAAVAPDAVTSGANNVTLTFSASNSGGDDVRQVAIYTPAGWTYQGATPPAGWSVSTKGNPVIVTFGTTTDYLPSGATELFSLTFSSVPVVTNSTAYNFLVGFWNMSTKLTGAPTGSVETEVTVLPYQVVLTAIVPASFPTPPVADGIQYYDLTATVTDGTGPISGANVQFTTTVGGLGAASAISDTTGQALNTLTGPLSVTPVVATVTADYLGASDILTLNFDPYTGLALDYIPGSLSPVTTTQGDTVSFSLQVINSDPASVTLSTATAFSFSDTSFGGVSTYTSNLAASAPTTIATGQVATLTFSQAAVSPVFLPGSYYPDLFLTDGLRSGTRAVIDPVQVQGRATLLAVKSVSAVSDTINGTVNPKGIPGAVLQYTLSVSNVADGPADNDSVFLTEPIPTGTELFVGDLDGGGSPVVFADGSTTSGLTYSFVSLADGGDDIGFSGDASSPTFGYTPQDPDGDGFDPAVTYFRINPKGIMDGASGPPYPSFTVDFRVRIK